MEVGGVERSLISMLDNFDDLSNEDLDNIVKILKALKK